MKRENLTGNLFKEQPKEKVVDPKGSEYDENGYLAREALDSDYAEGLELARKVSPELTGEPLQEMGRFYARQIRARREKVEKPRKKKFQFYNGLQN